MTSIEASAIAERELLILETLRTQYESRGFDFFTKPSADLIPGFLGGYRPDAIARKSNQNVAIEIKNRRSSTRERLASIQKRFAAHPDWRLDVIYAAEDGDNDLAIQAPDLATVRARLKEVRELDRQGHPNAAFLLAWSLLEAAFRASGSQAESAPRTPGAVIQSLAMNGHVGPDTERRLRGLMTLRNRLAHGDLRVVASAEDTSSMLSAIQEIIEAGRHP